MNNNNQSNKLIKWTVTVGDFIVLNLLIFVFSKWHWRMGTWPEGRVEIFLLINNIALMLSMMQFSTVIHLRMVNAGEILRRAIGLTSLQAVISFLLLKMISGDLPIEWLIFEIGSVYVAVLVVKRLSERFVVKWYREAGRNIRMITLVGTDPELQIVYKKLKDDPTLGYHVLGYYGDDTVAERVGSVEDFLKAIETPESLFLGEELYLCVSRQEKSLILQASRVCDRKMVRFYYVPVSVESIGLNLKRELLDDIEIYTTYENPLQNTLNKAIKRLFDIILSVILLIPTIALMPIVWLMIKLQSPGPLFFTQDRTGLDGENFKMYKFRSMHVNKDADKLQATIDDPRKFPFGHFMRKSNLDELPQFWNVLKGDMSIVGPRPHMLAHTETYSHLINKYMVRHFLKPGITGWAQVTGFRGETKELWQMEERVKRDIWYMENWTIWLDIRIVWLTVKTMFSHDKRAY